MLEKWNVIIWDKLNTISFLNPSIMILQLVKFFISQFQEGVLGQIKYKLDYIVKFVESPPRNEDFSLALKTNI